MSVVAIRRYDFEIEIASDSISLRGDKIMSDKSQKIFLFGDFVVCFIGECRFKNYITYLLASSESEEERTYIERIDEIYEPVELAKIVKEMVNSYLNFYEYSKNKYGYYDLEAEIIFVINGVIYNIVFYDDKPFEVSILTKNFFAMGCGEEYAMGAMANGASPKTAIECIIPLINNIGGDVKEIIIPLELPF